MKTLIMIAAIALTNICTMTAQQDSEAHHRHTIEQDADSVPSLKTIETKTYNNVLSKTTVTEVHNDTIIESSTLNINLPWFPNVTRNPSGSGDGGDNSFSWSWTWDDPEYKEHMSDIYYAFAFMADKNLPVNSVKSWEWGMYPLSGVLLHSRNYQRMLTWGFGFSRTSFHIKDAAPSAGLPGFTTQRFRYWSWRLPVCAEFQSQDHKSFFSLGIEAEMRHHVRARKYGDALSDPSILVVGHDKDLVNPWGCNLLLQAGTNSSGVIARLSLTDLFDQNVSPLQAMPFSIGLSLGF